ARGRETAGRPRHYLYRQRLDQRGQPDRAYQQLPRAARGRNGRTQLRLLAVAILQLAVLLSDAIVCGRADLLVPAMAGGSGAEGSRYRGARRRLRGALRDIHRRAHRGATLQPETSRSAGPVLPADRGRRRSATIVAGGGRAAECRAPENRTRRPAMGNRRVPSPALGLLLQLHALADGDDPIQLRADV